MGWLLVSNSNKGNKLKLNAAQPSSIKDFKVSQLGAKHAPN